MSCECGDFQRALADSPDTVTDFVESLIDGTLIAEVVGQYQVGASPAEDDLDVDEGETLVQRTAVLKGLESGTPYVIAESTYVPDRLPALVRAQLSWTHDTIGRALVRSGLKVERGSPSQPYEPGEPAAHAIATTPSEIVWSRAYLLLVDGTATFAVQEWFLRPVLDAFERKALGAAIG